MAYYRPDLKLRKANEYIESLDDSEESNLIRYALKKKDERIEEQGNKLKDYHDWFKNLDRFLPNRNTVYK